MNIIPNIKNVTLFNNIFFHFKIIVPYAKYSQNHNRHNTQQHQNLLIYAYISPNIHYKY